MLCINLLQKLIILSKLQNNRTILGVDILQKADKIIHGRQTWIFASKTEEYEYVADITPDEEFNSLLKEHDGI